MEINILTIFPEMFKGFVGESIIKKAINNELLKINVIDIRDYTFDKHKQVDDVPFGGGAGMLLKPEPIIRALRDIQNRGMVIYTSPQGEQLKQKRVIDLAKEESITIIAGHYEGIDERVIDNYVDLELSIGDYVLTGGEIPAMVIADSIARLVPGVLGNKESYVNDSFFNGILDHSHYTRPAEFEDMKVPEVLLSGHHENIRKFRKKDALKRTYLRRPDLINKNDLDKESIKLLDEIMGELKDGNL